MLRKIPDSVVPFARDGVLSARRLGQVHGAERLERHARKRAVEIATSARDDAEREFERASIAGYRDGLARALAEWVPKLVDVLTDEAQLKLRTRQALDHYLDAVLTEAGVEAALVARCCEAAADSADAVSDTWTLYVPDDRGALVERLAEASPAILRIRRGDAPWPVLERGDVVIDVDPGRPAARHLADLLDAEALDAALEQQARAYAADTMRALRENSGFGKIDRDKTGDPT